MAKKENGMNKEEIIRMAKEAGSDDWGIFKDFMPELERFAALVAAAEREACAKLCENYLFENVDERFVYLNCAALVRARGLNV